jgi:MFS family permease
MRGARLLGLRSLAEFPSGFWWLWSSTLVNRLGTFVYPFLTLYLTATRGYSPATAGVVVSCYGIGSIAGSLLGGELSDRVGRRATLVAAQLASAVVTAALGVVTPIFAIAVLTLLLGAATGTWRPAVSAMITDLVPPGDRQRAFTVNYWAINIGFGVSILLAGFVAEAGYVWLFAGDAATTLACAVITVIKLKETRPVRLADPAGPASGSSHPRPPRAASRQVLRDTRFLWLTLLAFMVWLLYYQGPSTLPVVMHDHGLTARDYGLVFSVNGLLIVALQIPVSQLIAGRREGRLLAGSALLFASGLGLTAFAGSTTALYALSVAVWTLGEMVYSPASSALVANLAPDDLRGRYQGMFSLSPAAASFAGPIAGGFLLDDAGGTALWACCAVVGLLASAGFLLMSRGIGAAARLSETTGTSEAEQLMSSANVHADRTTE